MATGQGSSLFTDVFYNHNLMASSTTPSPFLDVASSRMPEEMKRLFPTLEYYATMDSVISPIVSKISEYPIMPLDYSGIKNDDQKKRIKSIMDDQMDTRGTLIQLSLNYNTYGSGFASIYFPFKRYFKCSKCNKVMFSEFVKEYEIRRMEFYFKCHGCEDTQTPKIYGDWPIRDMYNTKFIIWRPHDIDIVENPFSGKSQYFYDPPNHIVRMIETGHKFILDQTPKFILEAMKRRQRIKFKDGEIFHMRRPGMSRATRHSGWGIPLIMSSVLQAYLKKVYSKASEVTAILRSAPASILYPETNAAAGSLGNPLAATDITDFQDYMKRELLKHRRDPGYIMSAPHPVGQTVLFGDSKQYNFYQEIKFQDQQILEGMGVPREFLEGGLQFTGSSISLRILENQLFKQVKNTNDFVTWAFKRLSTVFNLGEESPSMKKFKMADDLQMLQLQIQAAQGGDLSKRRIWENTLDIDYEKEMEMIKEEDGDKFDSLRSRILSETEINLEAQSLQAKFNNKEMVRQQLDQFKEQARLYKKDPSYAFMLQQQADMANQQMAVQQEMMMQQQMQAQQKDLELKQMQQTRLAVNDDLVPEDEADQILQNVSKIDKLTRFILSDDQAPSIVLDEIFQTSPDLYKKIALRVVRGVDQIEDPYRAEIIFEHLRQNLPIILEEENAQLQEPLQ